MNIHVCSEYRRELFLGLTQSIDIDVCVVTETWIKEGKSNIILASLDRNRYVWFSRERERQKAPSGEGGVGFLVKRSIGAVKVVHTSKMYEMLWIEIERECNKIYIGAVYMSPEGSPRAIDSSAQLAELEAKITYFRTQGTVIVMGDFNARIGRQDSSFTRNGRRIFLPRKTEDVNVTYKAGERKATYRIYECK